MEICRKMKSTVMIHEIVESMQVEDRQEMMKALLALRMLVAEEVVSCQRNANKMIKLLYGNN